MSRLVASAMAGLLIAGMVGCCAGPKRFYQNAYGFNNPNIEHYQPGPPAPATTPPGYITPAVEPPPPDVAQ